MLKLKLLFWHAVVTYAKWKYPVHEVTAEEKSRVFKFRYQVYVNELRYGFMRADTVKQEIYDQDDFADDTIIIYVGNIQDPLATVRTRFWRSTNIPQDIYDKYDMASIDLKKISNVMDISYLMIKPRQRGGLVVLAMLAKLYSIAEKKRIFPEILFGNALPNLIDYYQKLGTFMYTKKLVYDADSINIPFVFIPFSPHHNEISSSPFYFYSKCYLKRNLKTFKEWGYTYPYGKDFTGILDIKPIQTIQSLPLLEYQSFETDVSDLIQIILHKSLVSERLFLRVQKGHDIVAKGVKDDAIYIILEGEFQVYLTNDRVICNLKQGEVFGELSMLIEPKVRSASVKALTDGSLLMIRQKLFSRLMANDPETASHLFLALCRILAHKLVRTTQQRV